MTNTCFFSHTHWNLNELYRFRKRFSSLAEFPRNFFEKSEQTPSCFTPAWLNDTIDITRGRKQNTKSKWKFKENPRRIAGESSENYSCLENKHSWLNTRHWNIIKNQKPKGFKPVQKWSNQSHKKNWSLFLWWFSVFPNQKNAYQNKWTDGKKY